MQNAASNALQLAATRYTAGTAPFSGGGVASGAQAEVVDLTGSFPKEAANPQSRLAVVQGLERVLA